MNTQFAFFHILYNILVMSNIPPQTPRTPRETSTVRGSHAPRAEHERSQLTRSEGDFGGRRVHTPDASDIEKAKKLLNDLKDNRDIIRKMGDAFGFNQELQAEEKAKNQAKYEQLRPLLKELKDAGVNLSVETEYNAEFTKSAKENQYLPERVQQRLEQKLEAGKQPLMEKNAFFRSLEGREGKEIKRFEMPLGNIFRDQRSLTSENLLNFKATLATLGYPSSLTDPKVPNRFALYDENGKKIELIVKSLNDLEALKTHLDDIERRSWEFRERTAPREEGMQQPSVQARETETAPRTETMARTPAEATTSEQPSKVYSPAYETDINQAKALLKDLQDNRGTFQRIGDALSPNKGLTEAEINEKAANQAKYDKLIPLLEKLEKAGVTITPNEKFKKEFDDAKNGLGFLSPELQEHLGQKLDAARQPLKERNAFFSALEGKEGREIRRFEMPLGTLFRDQRAINVKNLLDLKATLARLGYPDSLTDVKVPNQFTLYDKAGNKVVLIVRTLNDLKALQTHLDNVEKRHQDFKAQRAAAEAAQTVDQPQVATRPAAPLPAEPQQTTQAATIPPPPAPRTNQIPAPLVETPAQATTPQTPPVITEQPAAAPEQPQQIPQAATTSILPPPPTIDTSQTPPTSVVETPAHAPSQEVNLPPPPQAETQSPGLQPGQWTFLPAGQYTMPAGRYAFIPRPQEGLPPHPPSENEFFNHDGTLINVLEGYHYLQPSFQPQAGTVNPPPPVIATPEQTPTESPQETPVEQPKSAQTQAPRVSTAPPPPDPAVGEVRKSLNELNQRVAKVKDKTKATEIKQLYARVTNLLQDATDAAKAGNIQEKEKAINDAKAMIATANEELDKLPLAEKPKTPAKPAAVKTPPAPVGLELSDIAQAAAAIQKRAQAGQVRQQVVPETPPPAGATPSLAETLAGALETHRVNVALAPTNYTFDESAQEFKDLESNVQQELREAFNKIGNSVGNKEKTEAEQAYQKLLNQHDLWDWSGEGQ